MQISGQGPECEMCGQKHEPPCTIGLKQQGLIQKQMQYNKDSDKYEPSRGENLQTRTTTPYCMYCGEKGGQHTLNVNCWGAQSSMKSTFCGIIGHWADNCAERQRAFQEQQQAGHLCTFCGSQEHVYFNCVLYKENLKQSISNQNEEKYKTVAASQGSTGMVQTKQGGIHASKKEGSKAGTQEYATKLGSSQRIISMGGGGDKPPRKPHNTKKEPDTKTNNELEEEEEDSDSTETISISSVPSDYKVISKEGIEMSLRKFLKAKSKSRRRKRHRCRRGNGGGGDDSSHSSSDDDSGDDSDGFQIEVIRGKHGHRGQQGRKGAQGPPGPVITLPPPVQPLIYKPPDPNITLNSTGMEESFEGLSESLNKIFNQQANLNETLQGHVTLGVWAQGEQAQALRLLAESSQQ